MGNFTFNETKIKDVYIIDVKTYGDNRGYFMETYKESDFKAAGLDYNFVQDNQSSSRKGVLRGLHFQKTHPQAKLVRVLKGEVFDVAVDLRKGSKTYGQWHGELLSAENFKQFFSISSRFPNPSIVPSVLNVKSGASVSAPLSEEIQSRRLETLFSS